MMIYRLGASSLRTATFVADMDRDAVGDWSVAYSDDSEPRRALAHQSSLHHRWIPFEGELDFRTTEPTPKQALDFVTFSPASALVCIRDSVLERTESLWGLVEVLPLRCRDDDYSAIHAYRHYDILDLNASCLLYTSPSPRDRG